MCGRFASATKPTEAWLELLREWPDALFNRYNVSPTSQIGAFVEGECFAMRWGLVPSWSKEISSKYATFNARVEGIEDKPAFRNAWRKNQKCLIPARGYYEWRSEEGVKQPYYVTMDKVEADVQQVVFAGIWDACEFGGEALKSCTIITTESKGHLQQLHGRMPVMLGAEAAAQWLNSNNDKECLLDASLPKIEFYKVDKRVNDARHEDESLVLPV